MTDMEKQIASEYAEYFSFLQKYRDELQGALENEREKRKALLESNMDRLETVLSMQQAQTMKLHSLEARRLQLQGAFGSETETASQFVSGIGDGVTRTAFSQLVKEMAELAADIKEQNSLALDIAKTNLKLLERIFPSNSFDQTKATYDPKGERRSDNDGHSLELKF